MGVYFIEPDRGGGSQFVTHHQPTIRAGQTRQILLVICRMRSFSAEYMVWIPPGLQVSGAAVEVLALVMTTAGEKAGSNSNDYVRTTVYLTIVLFFAGIGSHFDWPFHPLRPRWFQRRTASGSHRAPSYRPEPWLMHPHSNPYFAFSRSGH